MPSESSELRVKDIDLNHNQIIVKDAKGKRDHSM
jgi:hypothetical protein